MTNSHQVLGRQTLGRQALGRRTLGRRMAGLGFCFALTLATGGVASAMPLSPAVDTGSQSAQIIEVRGGCGFGEHRGPYAGCRINNGPRGRIRASVTGLPYGCPPGQHRGPYGHCHF